MSKRLQVMTVPWRKGQGTTLNVGIYDGNVLDTTDSSTMVECELIGTPFRVVAQAAAGIAKFDEPSDVGFPLEDLGVVGLLLRANAFAMEACLAPVFDLADIT